MNLTNKTHYNPCFWTAYWNFNFLINKRLNPDFNESPRKKEVFVLNLKSDKIYKDVTQNVFWKKKFGLAKITKEGALNFTKRNFPDNLKEIVERYEKDESEMTLDFENLFSIMEDSYKKHLQEVVLENKPVTDFEKAHLMFFILFQMMRNPNSLDRLINIYKLNGWEKFEVFVFIKHMLSDKTELGKLTTPFVVPTWKIYKIKRNKFPLSDSPVMIRNHNLMVALAPNIMLEINLAEKCDKVMPCIIKKRLSIFKYRKFLKRTIENSSKEIIFGEATLLEKLKNSRTYKRQLKLMKNAC